MTLDFNSFNLTKGNTVDNPWIFSQIRILQNETKSADTYDIDLSEYLPNDDNDYEALWQFSAYDGNALLYSDDVAFGGVFTDSSIPTRVNGVLPISKNRNVKLTVYTQIVDAYLTFGAYRRTTNIGG